MPAEKMNRIAEWIVKKRHLIFFLFAFLVLFSVFGIGKVQINSNIATLLPQNTATRKGIDIMAEEFVTCSSAKILVRDISKEDASLLAERLKEHDMVFSTSFDDTSSHYADGCALIGVSFTGTDSDPAVEAALADIKEQLSEYDAEISTTIGSGSYASKLAKEMVWVLLFSVLVIIAVMLFTSKSYFEPIILFLVFGVAILLNKGTNFLLGSISSITDSISIILQLALAIDYAIILCHRFQEEYDKKNEVEKALISALSSSMIEISSSSLTTISGLAALTLMQFRLGFDLGTVLIKAILCSMLTVFLLMPGLIFLFHDPLLKTRHRRLVPDITGWGRFLSSKKKIFLILFILQIPFSVFAFSHCDYVFSTSTASRIRMSESDRISRDIAELFGDSTSIAVLVPAGDYEKEKVLFEKVTALSEIQTGTALCSVEVSDGIFLTDSVSVSEFSSFSGVGILQSGLLFTMYHSQYPETGSLTDPIPLIDLAEYLIEASADGSLSLNEEQTALIDSLKESLDYATSQLQGKNWSRLVFTAALPIESEESTALVTAIRDLAEEVYGEGPLVIGDITSADDLRNSFKSDNILVSVLTILFVFLVLMASFRSFAASVLLIFVIQGSIWINFSFPFLTGTNISFITYLIVSAIQMGATIDYAIVLYSRFRSLRQTESSGEAMARAVNESFPTILTSGSIMTAAGLLIAFLTTDVYVSSIGLAVGRGAFFSMVLVLSVLPQMVLAGEKLIEKTTLRRRK